ncbi:hypothetical protein EAG_15142 [Camponotus floridanus]|uniref:Uncharacterized protein n=1 Tax=Camponotus floridanus TaxID=104421 RepID=E1ZYP3_CAMFO|nr:hypothetical protein EAG_15142 [Camponotus floridanus]
MQSNTILRSDVGSTEKLMGNNNNLNNNGSPGADIMFQMEDEGLTQLGSVFQSAYQSIVGGGPQVGRQTLCVCMCLLVYEHHVSSKLEQAISFCALEIDESYILLI